MGISEVTLSKEELTSLTEKIGMQKGIVCTWDFLDTSRFIDKKRAEGLTKEKYIAFIEKRQEKMRTRVDWGDRVFFIDDRFYFCSSSDNRLVARSPPKGSCEESLCTVDAKTVELVNNWARMRSEREKELEQQRRNIQEKKERLRQNKKGETKTGNHFEEKNLKEAKQEESKEDRRSRRCQEGNAAFAAGLWPR